MFRLGLAISLISASAIGYEILMMRLLSIIQWQHFVSMIISVALLGYGASGTFVALLGKWLMPRFVFTFICNAIFFGISTTASFMVAQHIPFNPFEILWDNRQFLNLLALCMVLFVPFFCAANCICITFAHFKDLVHRVYRYDLIGAGAGALCVVFLLFLFSPADCLRIFGSAGLFAAALVAFCFHGARSFRVGLILICCGLLVPFLWPKNWLSYRISEYKGLSLALRVRDAAVLSEHFSPLAWLTVISSPTIPFRYAPGMSLNCSLEPPPQLGVFSDGDAFSPITRCSGGTSGLEFLDCLSSALPFHLLKEPEVLVLGAGGGMDVLMALSHGAKTVDAVELNPQMVRLTQEVYAGYAGGIYNRKDVNVHISEARGFVAGSNRNFDLIVLSLLDSFVASVSGAGAINPSYLYTVEALKIFFQHLKPGGYLAITRWLKVPPRDALKLFATAVLALEQSKADQPDQQLAMIRSWKTTTLLVKRGPLTTEDIRILKSFCAERSFDTAYYPGMSESEANQYNLLDQPYFYLGAMALLGKGRGNFLGAYKFDVNPGTDNRPYFFDFFKWRTLRESLSLKGQGGLTFLELGYPLLMATLLQAVLLSFLSVLGPLVAFHRDGLPWGINGSLVFYFFSLGLAFLFVEMAFIQKFVLFLHHPIYATTVVISAFLFFAGLGSGFSTRISTYVKGCFPGRSGFVVAFVVAGISFLCLLYIFLLPEIFHLWISKSNIVKVPICVLLIAPLAFLMGTPFPLGLSAVAGTAPNFIPWAWGVNGCASVISPILAILLSVHFGFNAVLVIAMLLYFSAAFSLHITQESLRAMLIRAGTSESNFD